MWPQGSEEAPATWSQLTAHQPGQPAKGPQSCGRSALSQRPALLEPGILRAQRPPTWPSGPSSQRALTRGGSFLHPQSSTVTPCSHVS